MATCDLVTCIGCWKRAEVMQKVYMYQNNFFMSVNVDASELVSCQGCGGQCWLFCGPSFHFSLTHTVFHDVQQACSNPPCLLSPPVLLAQILLTTFALSISSIQLYHLSIMSLSLFLCVISVHHTSFNDLCPFHLLNIAALHQFNVLFPCSLCDFSTPHLFHSRISCPVYPPHFIAIPLCVHFLCSRP